MFRFILGAINTRKQLNFIEDVDALNINQKFMKFEKLISNDFIVALSSYSDQKMLQKQKRKQVY